MIPAAVVHLFFCEDQVAKPGLFSPSFSIPGKQVRLNANDLAIEITAFAFFSLSAGGFIKLELIEKNSLFGKKQHLQVAKLQDFPETENSEEARLMQHISYESKPLSKIITAYLSKAGAWPQQTILINTLNDALHHGLGALQGGINLLKGVVPFIVNENNLTDAKEAYAPVRDEWLKSGANRTALLKGVKSAISNKIASEHTHHNNYD